MRIEDLGELGPLGLPLVMFLLLFGAALVVSIIASIFI